MGKKLSKIGFINIALISIILVHVFIFLHLIFFPYPELFIYPYLTKIGLIPYKEILDQHFPGIMFMPINLNTLGITSISSFRILSILLLGITHLFLFLSSKKIIKSKYLWLAPNFLYLFWHLFFDGTTVWIESFETPLLILSFYFLTIFIEDKDKRKAFWSGFFLSMAILFKQVVIPLYAVLFLYLFITQKRDNLYRFAAGSLIPMLILFFFVLLNGIPQEFVYWTVTFNLTVFREMGRKFATNKEYISMLFLVGPSLVSMLYLWIKKEKRELMPVLAILFLGSFAFDFARFDFIHLQPVIPFAVLLIVWACGRVRMGKMILLVFLCFTLIIGFRSIIRNWGGEVKFFGSEDESVFSEVKSLTKPGDHIFAFATYPYIYAVTNTRPSGNIFVFQFPWFMKIAEERELAALMIDPPKVVIRDVTAQADGKNLVSFMPRISNFIEKYYVVKQKVGTTDIMIPK